MSMCYYKTINKSTGDLELHYRTRWRHDVWVITQGVQKGFDFPKWPIMTKGGLVSGQWGLLPAEMTSEAQVKDFRAKYTGALNAKIENLSNSPLWSRYRNNRCLVPITSFNEWRHEEVPGRKTVNKVPYQVCTDSEITSVAGIYSDWRTPEGEIVRTYAVVTTQANETMAYIHNSKQRMPVLIKQEDEQRWLDGEDAAHFAFPYSANTMGFVIQE